jgi:uncharacterized protein YndB with AHSA1/START domain
LPEPHGETSVVEREVRVEAEPETVFPFFTDPEKMVRWIGVGATLDPRPGGVFSVNTMGDDYFMGEFVAVEPHTRVVFTWGYRDLPGEESPFPPGSTTVEVELVRDGDATIVHLRHWVPPQLVDFHTLGWEHYLGRLAVVAAGGDPGPDAMLELFEAMRSAGDRDT